MTKDPGVSIRPEIPEDRDAVFRVNAAAFGADAEARLVNRLRVEADPFISLVAEMDGKIVGHICFSPVTLAGHPEAEIMGLAPMAVLPEHQRQGIGTLLVRAGLDHCRVAGASAVIVLGHPGYYPRFGFVPASRFGITSEYDAPDEAFMALELVPDSLTGSAGTARYHSAFGNL